MEGINESRRTWPQLAPTTNAVMGYATSTTTSHFNTFAICRYSSRMVAHEIRNANTTTNQRELIPESIEAASAMPARSAAMLIVLAIKRAITTASSNHLGNRCLRFPARPRPVTLPMRAHIICTAAINGHVSSAVHSNLVPSCAPAMEYVAMPDGSSSAAPVMMPGPSDFSSARIQRDGPEVDKRNGLGIPSGSTWDSDQPKTARCQCG